MSEILQTNVFFVITSFAVVVLTTFACIALYYIIKILRNVRDMTDRMRRASELIAEDAMAVRSFVNEGIIGNIRAVFDRFLRNRPPRRSKKSISEEDDDDASD